MVTAERGIAWIFALAAVILGVIGLLRGFGIIGTEGVDIAGLEGGIAAAVSGDFWEGIVWMLPAFAFGAIAWSFAGGRTHSTDDANSMMRYGAYVMAVVTVAVGALALLVGFGLLNADAQPTDGVLWGMVSILSGLLTSAAYAAIPSPVADEDYLVALVESRVGPAAGGTTRARPGAEPTR